MWGRYDNMNNSFVLSAARGAPRLLDQQTLPSGSLNHNERCDEVTRVRVCNMYTCLFGLRLEGGGQHLREEFEEDGKKELHERNDDEHREGHQAEQVNAGPQQLEAQETNDVIVCL